MRSIRRHHKLRMVEKTKQWAKHFSFGKDKEEVNKRAEDWAKRNADNREPCRCSMCNCPRKHLKGDDRLTMQERRARDVRLLVDSD